MSAATPKGHHAPAAVFNTKPLEQAREFFDEEARKRLKAADAAAAETEANMARAMELSLYATGTTGPATRAHTHVGALAQESAVSNGDCASRPRGLSLEVSA